MSTKSFSQLLLKDGVVLIHNAQNHIVPTRTDILIEHGMIVKIGQDLEATERAEIVDCADKLISPGFVDTHHHGWQTQLKGRHANEQLLQYMATGNLQSFQFSPEDVFYGQLADWVMKTFEELADQGPFGAGRVTLGFAFDLFFLPPEMIKGLFAQVKGKGVKTITTHGSVSLGNVVQSLSTLDLLDETIIISHGGDIKATDAELIKAAGAHLSSTPSSELQMAMGRPYCFDSAFADGGVHGHSIGLQDNASLGIDCHTITGGSILTEARVGLQNARNTFGEYHLKQGKIPRTMPDNLSVEAAFNLATIKGAEAVNMGKEIGRIAEGYKADVVIFDALSPSMVAAAQHDPVAAVILHSTPDDIETVIVDGVVRKQNGKLLPVAVDDAAQSTIGKASLTWTDVAKNVVVSRARIQDEIDKIDFEEATAALHKLFHIDETRLVDVA
ncbi:hypothetical protein E8E13_004045 [Curvularia kusanoi]|uniref:Amidohydrolase-related domain-containing protein n=1 Tax=Curvularia kusanoi TaxID=90978 RepID=A0A9P4TEW9_CURKU|nr:hypothetical protein E8E13_004045 [Curvularia kusanoi]